MVVEIARSTDDRVLIGLLTIGGVELEEPASPSPALVHLVPD